MILVGSVLFGKTMEIVLKRYLMENLFTNVIVMEIVERTASAYNRKSFKVLNGERIHHKGWRIRRA